MCTLKGACQYILFDVRGVEINTRDQSNVGDVEDGVCSFYATLHTEYRFHVGDVGPSLLQGERLFI